METPPKHPVLRLSWQDIEDVRRECGIEDLNQIREAIDKIEDWYRLQTHMTKEQLDRNFVEKVLILSRGSVELAKKKIDAIATVRTVLPEFYADRAVDSREFKQLSHFVRIVPLPKLSSKDLSRVLLVRMGSENVPPNVTFNALSFFRFLLLINDNRMYVDYPTGDTYVLDMAHFRFLDFTNFSLGILKKVQVIANAYGIKIKGIHFINAPSYVDKVIFLLKQGLKDKIANRIEVHSSMEHFYSSVPKDCLPADYGGPHDALENLYEEWLEYLRTETSLRHSEDANQLKTDESKRTGGRVDEEMLGIPGSFRTLSVD